ncbi:MAG: 4-hydroxy-3-methylbut-2-enyl diphosphate reductase [Phycisphaerae bacterium]
MSPADGKTRPTIEVAEGAGVCFGVKRALRLAEEALAADTPVCSLGPLIHNPQEVGRLTEKGFQVIDSLDEAPNGATLLIRSHGVSPDVVAAARRRGHAVIDATCPLVRRVQTLATGLEREGYQVIVAGDAAHPEVRAIRGHAPSAVVVSDPAAVADLEAADRVALVAQTTFSPEVFRQMAAALVQRSFGEVRVIQTICTATVARQRSAAELAERADLMIVIGGRNSANTNRLAERCAAHGVPTFHVEVADEVEPEWLRGRPRVGVTAGASTPQWIIDAVCDRIRRLQCRMDGGKV